MKVGRNNCKTDIILKFHPPHFETNQQLDKVSSDTKSFAVKFLFHFYVILLFLINLLRRNIRSDETPSKPQPVPDDAECHQFSSRIGSNVEESNDKCNKPQNQNHQKTFDSPAVTEAKTKKPRNKRCRIVCKKHPECKDKKEYEESDNED